MINEYKIKIIKYIQKNISNDNISKLVNLRNKLFGNYKKSYSQCGEDMILEHLFNGKYDGFYVDIGAYHPIKLSNTYHFYKKGWSGINIDAMPNSMKIFNKLRKRDINLEIGIGNKNQELEYFMFREQAFNGFKSSIIEKKLKEETPKNVLKVKIFTINEILNIYKKDGQIDFLSIDVEGFDLDIIKSIDYKTNKINIILVEDHNFNINKIKDSELYNFMKYNNYEFIAKTGPTLFFKLKN